MKTLVTVSAALGLALVPFAGMSAAATTAPKPDPDLVKALKDVKVTLETGIQASEASGTPIAAEFELDAKKLELTVYTMKADKYAEVVVDQTSGKVLKTEALKDAELKEAKDEGAAIAKAKLALTAAIAEAKKDHKGYRVIRVKATMKDAHPVAMVSLLKDDGKDLVDVQEKLE